MAAPRQVTSFGLIALLLTACGATEVVVPQRSAREDGLAAATDNTVVETTEALNDKNNDVDPQLTFERKEPLRASVLIAGDRDGSMGCRVLTESPRPTCSGGWGIKLSLTREELEAAGVAVLDINKEAGLWTSKGRVLVKVAPPFTFVPEFGLTVGKVLSMANDDGPPDPYRPQDILQGSGELALGGADSDATDRPRRELEAALSPRGTVFLVNDANYTLVVTLLPLVEQTRDLLVRSVAGEMRVTSLLTE